MKRLPGNAEQARDLGLAAPGREGCLRAGARRGAWRGGEIKDMAEAPVDYAPETRLSGRQFLSPKLRWKPAR